MLKQQGSDLVDNAEALAACHQLAQSGRFPEMLTTCRKILSEPGADITCFLDIGALLSSYGFLSEARACYEKAQILTKIIGDRPRFSVCVRMSVLNNIRRWLCRLSVCSTEYWWQCTSWITK